MKLQVPHFTRNQSVQRPPRIVLLIIFTLVFLALISLEYPLPDDPIFESKISGNLIFFPKIYSDYESTSASNVSKLAADSSSTKKVGIGEKNDSKLVEDSSSRKKDEREKYDLILVEDSSSSRKQDGREKYDLKLVEDSSSRKKVGSSSRKDVGREKHDSTLVENSSSRKKGGSEKHDSKLVEDSSRRRKGGRKKHDSKLVEDSSSRREGGREKHDSKLVEDSSSTKKGGREKHDSKLVEDSSSMKKVGRVKHDSKLVEDSSSRKKVGREKHDSKLVEDSSSKKKVGRNQKCDIFSGEWVPNPEAPYYTNLTCNSIHEHQNCMKFGRPDTDFMKWRWKPDECELPIFDPAQFLKIVRGKSLAFIGDSVARNQMQSLMCLLSRVVEDPIDISELYSSDVRFKRFRYPSYNFTLATFWSPYLVRTKEVDPDPDHKGPFNLYLDEFDEDWTTKIEDFDYIIISAGHWFFRPTMYSQNSKLVGCLYCSLDKVRYLPMHYGYRRAFRTAFRAINSIPNFKGITFLRTFAPSHFENGRWDAGGNCLRKKPFGRHETRLEGDNFELHRIQLEEFKIAEREGRKRGKKFRLLDTTQATLLRPDGHPSRYGHLPNANVSLYNDCVHWCLPGPIDTWNDFLLEMLKRK